MKKTIKGLVTACIFTLFGATTVFAGKVSGKGDVNISFEGNKSKATSGWEQFTKGYTVRTTEKCSITIQPKTDNHDVTSKLQIRKQGTFSNSVVSTRYFFQKESYGNKSSRNPRELTWNISYSYSPSRSGNYDYYATTSGVSDKYFTEYTGSYRY